MADIEQSLLRSPALLLFYIVLSDAILHGLDRRERGIDRVLIYEDEPGPVV
jgi:hypothetical protein